LFQHFQFYVTYLTKHKTVFFKLMKMPGIPTELLKGYPDIGVLLTIGTLPSSGKILPIHC
jgi:hypothetical protein